MIKAELLSTKVLWENEELFVKYSFAQIARWTPKELGSKKVTIKEHLDFLESCIQNLENPEIPIGENLAFTVIHNSGISLIGNSLYFMFTKSKWKKFVHEEIEKLYLQGIIQLS